MRKEDVPPKFVEVIRATRRLLEINPEHELIKLWSSHDDEYLKKLEAALGVSIDSEDFLGRYLNAIVLAIETKEKKL